MKHNEKFELIKDYYDRHLWSADRVRKAVGKWITAEECAKILEKYANNTDRVYLK